MTTETGHESNHHGWGGPCENCAPCPHHGADCPKARHLEHSTHRDVDESCPECHRDASDDGLAPVRAPDAPLSHTWAGHIDCDPAECTVAKLARSGEWHVPRATDAPDAEGLREAWLAGWAAYKDDESWAWNQSDEAVREMADAYALRAT